LTNPGGGGTIGNPDLLATISAYRLLPGSPMAGAGLNLGVLFAASVGSHDYYGNPVQAPPAVGASE